MDQNQTKRIADQFIAELHQIEQGDVTHIDALVDMFADSAELTNPIIKDKVAARTGRNEITEFWREYAASFGNIHSDFFNVTTSDHAAGLFWRSTGTDPVGQSMQYEGVSLLTFNEDGKISHFKEYFDRAQLTLKTSMQ